MAHRKADAPPCPRCGSSETEPLRNFGRPVEGRFDCIACERRPGGGNHWFGPNNPPDCGGTGYDSATQHNGRGPDRNLNAVAAALCMTREELSVSAEDVIAHAGPAAYLRLLRDKDPVAWRQRMIRVFKAEAGNASAVARRLGLARNGIAWLLRENSELATELERRWPGRRKDGV